MNQDQFARMVVEEGGFGSFLDDLLDFVKELLPVVLELFQNCPANRIHSRARRGRLFRLRFALRRQMSNGDWDAFGEDLVQQFRGAACKCSEQQISELLQSAA